MSPRSARKQKKREMDRIRFATMSNEKKAEKNAKQKEIYIIEKNMKVHHYMFYFEPNAYIATLALTKKSFWYLGT